MSQIAGMEKLFIPSDVLDTRGYQAVNAGPDPGCTDSLKVTNHRLRSAAIQYSAAIKAQFSKMARTMYGPLGPKNIQQPGKATCHKCSSLHGYGTAGIINLVKTHLDKEWCMTAQAKKDKQPRKNVGQPVALGVQLCSRQRRGSWQKYPP
ncbi:hypothetical protein B0H14DRAFT_2596753 [Mycena olivaceomarginata]|nr:hypothetical protein B0H14DRAFT_2596753 [Mycena olivaceomarginata]